ncbi:MAG TPA: DUF4166 domain-containing protein [Magnetospirillum sp.]|nr:DUF4166 domain-containing protein [Magnetospirillum sp.]
MEWALAILGIQGVLGAYDNFRNHEFQAGLPHRQSQWLELLLHAVREGLYCVLFPTMAWLEWRGWLAGVLAALIVAELVVTCWDFVEEDRTRTLSANERVLHTLLTLNYGAFLALFVPVLVQWGTMPAELAVVPRGMWSWLMTVYSLGVLVFGVRELVAGLAHWRRRNGAASTQSVHRRALGGRFDAMPAPIRLVHAAPGVTLSGSVEVSPAPTLAGRWLLGFMGLPRLAGSHSLVVRVLADGDGELWERRFADATFASRFQAAGVPEQAREYFGPFRLDYQLAAENGEIRWSLVGARLFGVPLPKALAPEVTAREWVADDGAYRMKAQVSLPGLGPLLGYGGSLAPISS